MCPHPAHSVDIPVGMLWAHNWPHLWPTLLCVGQPTVNPHFELSRLGPTRAPQCGGHICPTFHAGLGAQSGLPTWVRFSTRNGPTLAPRFFFFLRGQVHSGLPTENPHWAPNEQTAINPTWVNPQGPPSGFCSTWSRGIYVPGCTFQRDVKFVAISIYIAAVSEIN